jgi:ABC-2 type transport system ATP-binding protein
LSTHIVDDVTDLCSRMAIIVDGRIVELGAPAQLLSSLAGKVWQRAIDRGALDEYRKRMHVISTRLRSGRTVIHVLADSVPEPGFEPLESSLEDVYFATLANARRNSAAAA